MRWVTTQPGESKGITVTMTVVVAVKETTGLSIAGWSSTGMNSSRKETERVAVHSFPSLQENPGWTGSRSRYLNFGLGPGLDFLDLEP
jgi:hypothetical protein